MKNIFRIYLVLFISFAYNTFAMEFDEQIKNDDDESSFYKGLPWFALGSALNKGTLMDFKWQFSQKLDLEFNGKTCSNYIFLLDKKSKINLTETEIQIEQAGFGVNNKNRMDVVLTIDGEKVVLYVAENQIDNFLKKFPIIKKSELHKILCAVNAESYPIAQKKFKAIQALAAGNINAANDALLSLPKENKSSPSIQRKLVAAAAINPRTIKDSLKLLGIHNISVASLDQNDRDELFNEALADVQENGSSERLSLILTNYNENEPDKEKVLEIMQQMNTKLPDIVFDEKLSTLLAELSKEEN